MTHYPCFYQQFILPKDNGSQIINNLTTVYHIKN